MKKQLLLIICSFFIAGMTYANTPVLWGMTSSGGSDTSGVIFKIDADGSGYTVVHVFQRYYGRNPFGKLVKAPNNKLYGMTAYGGIHNDGTIFSIDPVTNAFAVVHDFGNVDGDDPRGSLCLASNGLLYGVTQGGSTFGEGILFSFNPANNAYTKLVIFGNHNGSAPYCSLIQASDGLLYGTTSAGGTGLNNIGVVFSFNPSNNAYAQWDLPDGVASAFGPEAGLFQYGSYLYGTTRQGGTCNLGTVFSFDMTSHTFAHVMEFCGNSPDYGSFPIGGVTAINPGKFYGLASQGGSSGKGVLYSFTNFTTAHSAEITFDGVNKGSNPQGSLVRISDGKLYGTTQSGGVNNFGTVFSYDPSTGTFTKLHDFNFRDGADPYGDLFELICTTAPSSPGAIHLVSGNVKVCPGDICTYSVTAVPGLTYSWTSFPGAFATFSGGANASITVNYTSAFTASSGTIKVAALNDCGFSSWSSLVVSRNNPATPGAISGPASVCKNQSASYSIATVAGATGYSWTWPGTASAIISADERALTLHWGTAAGTISAKAANACGISAARSLTVKMTCREGEISETQEESNVIIYPNPAETDKQITIKFNSPRSSDYFINVFDATGRKVFSSAGEAEEGENHQELDLNAVAKGIYIVNLKINDGNKVMKLIVE